MTDPISTRSPVAPRVPTAIDTTPPAPTTTNAARSTAAPPPQDSFSASELTCDHRQLRELMNRQRGEVCIAPPNARPAQTVAQLQAQHAASTPREVAAEAARRAIHSIPLGLGKEVIAHRVQQAFTAIAARAAQGSAVQIAFGALGGTIGTLGLAAIGVAVAGRGLSEVHRDVQERHAAELGELRAVWAAYEANRSPQAEAVLQQRMEQIAQGMLAARNPEQLNARSTIDRMNSDGYFALGLRLGTGVER